ncbi:ABC transporter substrate-binding protein [Bifidobacterium callitrichos]|uniref:Peptide ABC transporter substrate-binding protein n=1 Tax=Bifidobacterium callitrichos DSM 23973 TaxID=1437609 RepID=A0A087A5R5_9BIFI|nr:ABC transporter substrate-binding protein [Bifidobacterium callitrichos]KFI54115.1 peptide ABC transporter substrate-binding protein [Bifidobacterium callitrichos DSM 23973]
MSLHKSSRIWNSHAVHTIRHAAAGAIAALLVTGLAACGGTASNGASSSAATANSSKATGQAAAIIVGTTDKVVSLDPAGISELGSIQTAYQIYAPLFAQRNGKADIVPNLAADNGTWNEDGTQFTVKLKSNLKFTNGHALTSSDVKFSIDRIKEINSENGPVSVFANITGVDAPDPTTVVFTTSVKDDVTLKPVLSMTASGIVDEQSYPKDKLATDDEVVKDNGFSGAYSLKEYKSNDHALFARNADYQGIEPAHNKQVTTRYYADSSNLKLAVQQGDVDVAYRSLTPTDITDLKKDGKLKVVTGNGGGGRYLVFNLRTQPYGSKQQNANADKAKAVRQAVADLVDRAALAKNVYQGTYKPLYSFIPDGQAGFVDTLTSAYGDGSGKPDVAKARKTLADAGVTTPVKLNIQYNTDHYGPSSADEYAAIKTQLEDGGLFSVDVQQTEWVQYSKQRVVTDSQDGDFPAYQIGWAPDYPDPSDYLIPYFAPDGFVSNGYENPQVAALLKAQAGQTDESQRLDTIEQVQQLAAKDLPILPILQSVSQSVTGGDISGVVMDTNFVLRYPSLERE